MSTQRSETGFNPSFFAQKAAAREQIKNLVLGLDFDGCTDSKIARDKLADDIANFVVEHPEIESIDFIISSLRQNFFLDYYNAAIQNPRDDMGRTQSCTALSEGFLNAVSVKIRSLLASKGIQRPIPALHFHPLLLSDIFNDLADGITLDKMAEFHHYTHHPDPETPFVTVQNRQNQEVVLAGYERFTESFEAASETEAENTAFDFYDTSKILLLWIQMQYFAHRYGKDKPFVFRFVDDNLSVIGGVTQFFSKNRHLMPENCSLECMYMSSNFHHYPPEYKPSKGIKGTGPLYDAYRNLGYQLARNVDDYCAEIDEAGKTAMIKALLLTLNPSNEEDISGEEVEKYSIFEDEPRDLATAIRPSNNTQSHYLCPVIFRPNGVIPASIFPEADEMSFAEVLEAAKILSMMGGCGIK